ncbi:mycorrhiza-induced WD40-repeat domain protein [Flagelloscypha sp. PMI_526]|nr:mycorrhiza-induced WD40-repeat domain protein [Flagelloscypha sp. PMI_526]
MAKRTAMQNSPQNSLILNSAFMTLVAHGVTGGIPPPLVLDARSRRDAAWDFVATAVQLTKESSEALKDVPYVNAIAGPLDQIIHIRDEIQDNKDRTWDITNKSRDPFKELEQDLHDFQKFLADMRRKENSDALTSIERDLNDFMQRTQFRKLVGIEARTINIEAKTTEIVDRLRDTNFTAVLNALDPVRKAIFDSPDAPPRGPCTKGTRIEVLSKVDEWALEPHDHRIYCLEGIAGTGKTTITYSVCQTLRERGSLGGSFFCSRMDLQCNDANRIAMTLMAQLAEIFPFIQHELVKLGSSLDRSFRNVLVTPLQAVAQSFKRIKIPVIFLIDALDECSNQDHDLVERDIRLFITESLTQLGERRHLSHWPSEEQLVDLVKRSGSLFIFAATACKHIGAKGDARIRLAGLLEVPRLEGIDELYRTILEQSFHGLTGDEEREIRNVLAAVASAQTLLTLESLTTLLHLRSTADELLTDLHSILRVSVDSGHVSIFHASFPDFLHNVQRSKSYFVASTQANFMMTTRCLRLMNSSLRHGMVVNTAVSETWPPGGQVEPALSYACRFWPVHCALSKPEEDLISEVLEFLEDKSLQWIECASHVGGLYGLIRALGRLETWVPKRMTELSARILDARRFIAQNTSILTLDPNEVYRSCLAWLPNHSPIKVDYDIGCSARVAIFGLDDSWDACELVISNVGEVNAVAFSNDDSRIVSGSDDGIVRILNAVSGEVENVLTGHSDGVESVAFSSDDSYIVSGSEDGTVRIWNAISGELENILTGHSDRVTSVAISSDGSHIVSGSHDRTVRIWNALTGNVKNVLTAVTFSSDGSRIASSSHDKTVRLWNASTGELEKALLGHTYPVQCVAFSRDGSQIVTCSTGSSVRIWNVVTGQVENVLTGHSHWVTSVSFSNNGSRIISGSRDSTMRLWNHASSQSDKILPGHTAWITSISFSADGSRILTGSEDMTVRVWNACSGELESVLTGHSDVVTSVAFSKDDSRIITISHDDTALFWNASTGKLEKVVTNYSNWGNSVDFFEEEPLATTCLNASTVSFWDISDEALDVDDSGPYLECSNISNSSLLITREYILHQRSNLRLWIPCSFSKYISFATHGDVVVLGYPTGRVLVIKFDT